jgi:hypothetical protein
MIAQDVEELLEKLNIDTKDFAAFIKSPKVTDVFDENGEYHEETIAGEYVYSLRYEEFIAPALKVIQSHEKEIIDTNERINYLENIVTHLMELVMSSVQNEDINNI